MKIEQETPVTHHLTHRTRYHIRRSRIESKVVSVNVLLPGDIHIQITE